MVIEDEGGGGDKYLTWSTLVTVGGGEDARSAKADKPACSDSVFAAIVRAAVVVGVVGVMSSAAGSKINQ